MYINNYYFEEIYDDEKFKYYSGVASWAIGKTLNTFYEKPSETKEYIYEWWRQFIGKTDCIECMGVYYGNCQSFGITAFYDDGKRCGIVRITKDHDRIYFRKGDKNDEC